MVRHDLRGVSAAVLLLLASVPPSAAQAQAQAQEFRPGYASELARLLPSVVEINTIVASPQGNLYYYGSGFVVDPSGLILTNRHVIAGAYDISVTLAGIGKVKGKVAYISGQIDVALVKVDVGRPLPVMKLGDSRTVKVGDEVLLLGNPLGVGLSVSHGVVSALNRDLGQSMYDHFIQTDGSLNHGNSGGPLVNMQGDVIGIDSDLISSPGNTGSVGIGLALPINDAEFILKQYLATGQVVIGTTGVHGQALTPDLATALGLGETRGILISSVDPKGPAEGILQPGDVMLEVEGHPATDGRGIARMVAVTPPGQTLTGRVLRNGEVKTVTIRVANDEMSAKEAMAYLGHPPKMAKGFATPSDPGLAFAEPTAKENEQPDARPKGLVIKTVAPNSAAADRFIVAGDVILGVDGKPVHDPSEFKQQLQAVVDAHRPFAALLIQADHGTRWVALPLAADHG